MKTKLDRSLVWAILIGTIAVFVFDYFTTAVLSPILFGESSFGVYGYASPNFIAWFVCLTVSIISGLSAWLIGKKKLFWTSMIPGIAIWLLYIFSTTRSPDSRRIFTTDVYGYILTIWDYAGSERSGFLIGSLLIGLLIYRFYPKKAVNRKTIKQY